MKAGKLFLSFFLLTIYSLGFIHDAVPHCHVVTETFEHAEDDHSGFHHHDNHHSEKTSFDHQDHFDVSLLDYVSCLLGQMQHPSSSDDQQFLVSKVEAAGVEAKSCDTTHPLVACVTWTFNQEFSSGSQSPEPLLQNEKPELQSHLQRGPPTLS